MNNNHGEHQDHTEHHRMMIRDFRRRFYVSIVLTLPVLALAAILWALWAGLGWVVTGFLGWYFGVLLWIAHVPVGAL
mgnify:CR=1 FL=1